MFNKNSFLSGFIGGAILPALSLFIFRVLLKGNYLIMGKPGVPYLVAVCINLFFVKYFYNKGGDKAGNGFVLVTFIFMAAIFIFKLQPIK